MTIALTIPYDMNHCRNCRITRDPDRLIDSLCPTCIKELIQRLWDNLTARNEVILYLLTGRTIERVQQCDEETTVAFLRVRGRDATGAPLVDSAAEQEGGR